MIRKKELLMLVDENDGYLGEKEKEECHRDQGCLHSAFLVMMTNSKAELMEAKRSGKKGLWPHFWDGTVAGHFHKGEDLKESMRKRVFEETGVSCRHLEFLFKFRYQAPFKELGSENEICHVYRTKDFAAEEIAINRDEVSEYRLCSIARLKNEVEKAPENYTPWFLIAFKKLLEIP